MAEIDFDKKEQHEAHWNQQLESVRSKIDDKCGNKHSMTENKSEIIKIEVKQEDLDLPCACVERDPCKCQEINDNALEEVNTLHYTPPTLLENFKSELYEESQDPIENTSLAVNRYHDTLPHDKKLKCELCPSHFTCKCSLKCNNELPNEEGVLLSKQCKTEFKSAGELERHSSKYVWETLNKCLACPLEFSAASDLQTHECIQNREKSYACKSCDYRGAEFIALIKHKCTRPAKKPFVCDICGYKCQWISNLKIHKRIHTGEKPHACDICDYRCNTPTNLAVHKRIHTGEKPYACDSCDYRCVQSTALKKHKRTHKG